MSITNEEIQRIKAAWLINEVSDSSDIDKADKQCIIEAIESIGSRIITLNGVLVALSGYGLSHYINQIVAIVLGQ